MGVKVLNIIPSKVAENSQTTQFTAEANTTIDKFTVTNTSAAVAKFSCNLVWLVALPQAQILLLKRNQLVQEKPMFVLSL